MGVRVCVCACVHVCMCADSNVCIVVMSAHAIVLRHPTLSNYTNYLQKSLVAENPPIITPEKVGDYMNNTR